jgi:hypothetical protein
MKPILSRLWGPVLLVPLAACGGGSDPAPSPTTTGVTLTVTSPLRMGQTTQATATESLSTGETRAVTSGFQSDAPTVATVTQAGVVSGVANGRATIFVIAGGRQGQQLLRVVPDYQGEWDGGLRVTSCSETGIFAQLDFCDSFSPGTTTGYSLDVAQTGEQLTATASYGAPIVFPQVSAAIREDGTAAFVPMGTFTEEGITFTIEANFAINSTRVGQLTGTVGEVWRFPNVSGEGRLQQDIVDTIRSSAATRSGADDGIRLRAIRKLLRQP